MSDILSQLASQGGTKQYTIDGSVYVIRPLPTSAALKITKSLIKTFGPALGVVIDNSVDELGPSDTMVTDTAIALCSNLDDFEIEVIIKAFVHCITCNGQPIDFENHFAGKLGTLALLVEYSIKENFGDFFTQYFKGKGLEIHTLKAMFQKKMMGTSSETSEV